MTLYTTTIIADHQRGLRYVGGTLRSWLQPGLHYSWLPSTGDRIELVDLETLVTEYTPELDAIVPDDAATRIIVPQHHLGLLTVDGVANRTIRPGRYLLWTERSEVSVELVSTEPRYAEVPTAFLPLVPSEVMKTVIIPAHSVGLLQIDGSFSELLNPGRYHLWAEDRQLVVALLDQREQELQISGQELMTADKVTLRLSLIATFQITDAIRAHTKVFNLRDALYAQVQIATRQAIAGQTLDTLLESRVEIARQLTASVQQVANAWGVSVRQVDIKDIILPGDMKQILNQVIQAEKQAAANVILRREETAATRSLANTAKILAQHPTLMRLKELEAMTEMAQHVEGVHLYAGLDPSSLPKIGQ